MQFAGGRFLSKGKVGGLAYKIGVKQPLQQYHLSMRPSQIKNRGSLGVRHLLLEGVVVPDEKQLMFGLQHIFGIGRHNSKDICIKLGIPTRTKAKDLTKEQVAQVRDAVSEYTTEGDLRREITENIARKVRIGCYQGVRHKLRLPVRGQRTKTNARTRKGKRRTVAGKKNV